jgi:hypothetical protein
MYGENDWMNKEPGQNLSEQRKNTLIYEISKSGH